MKVDNNMIAPRVIDKVREDFSDAAHGYDSVSGIHREVGRRMMEKLPFNGPGRVLDIGMGTGYLTEQVARVYPRARVIGLDFAKGMARYAASNRMNIHAVCADARALPFAENSMDLIISNLALQWVFDLDRVFGSCREILRDSGAMLITVFGKETLRELLVSFEKTFNASSVQFPRLVEGEELHAAAKKHFPDVTYKKEVMRIDFPTMTDVLLWVKRLGANGLGRHVFIGKEHMKRAADYYRTNYSLGQDERAGVFVTMEIVWLELKK